MGRREVSGSPSRAPVAPAADLRRMADDYQRRAGELKTGRPLLAASTEQSRPVVQQQQQEQPKKDD
jgi:hypothetical protein